MKVVAILNQKGGCGKSTLSMLMSLALASEGKKVLSIDCDPQGALTSFLLELDENRPGLFDLLGKFKTLKEVVINVTRGGISFNLIPADYKLDSIASGLDPYALKRAFKDIKGYDYIVLDNPPTVQGISRASAIFSDQIFVPSDIAIQSLGPTLYTLKSLEEIEKKGKVLLVGYKEPKENGGGYMADLMRRFDTELNGSIFGTIPRNVTTARAVADPETTWTGAKVGKILKPLRDLVEGK